MRELIGLVPAGGKALRWRPYRGYKELLPVGRRAAADEDGGITQVPKAVAEYTLGNMRAAGIRRVVMVINETKGELSRFFGNGRHLGLDIAYVCQDTASRPTGMPVAIDIAGPWCTGTVVALGLPDTIVVPEGCYSVLHRLYEAKQADLALGVFPTDQAGRLAPVEVDAQTSLVRRVFDKPGVTELNNSWNIALWSDRFTSLVRDFVRQGAGAERELLLSDAFNLAINRGLTVVAHVFTDGACLDVSCPRDWREAWQLLDSTVDGGEQNG